MSDPQQVTGEAEMAGIRRRVLDLLTQGESEALYEEVGRLHPSDIADLLEVLDEEEPQLLLMRSLPRELASEALAEMEEGDERAELLSAMAPDQGAELIHELADDDAADLIAELEPEDRALILAALPVEEAGDLQGLLLYDEETAGGRMTTALVKIRKTLRAGEAIQEVRQQGREVEHFYTVFVVDDGNRLEGTVPLDHLILSDPSLPVSELVEPVVASVLPQEDQEEVGRLLSKYNLVSMPVVNEFGQLMGRVTFDDVIDVMEAEQTEDILRLAGVSEEEELRADWTDAVRARLPWLVLNLFTATVAASVILVYEATIEEIAFLAFLMPVIAAMGGNAGTQALAVTIRRIALDDPRHKPFEAVSKEIVVGLLNGVVLGILFAGISYALRFIVGESVAMLNPYLLGAVVMFAMWGNLVVAGFAGAFVPSFLSRLGVDPAVASSVFVHTFTDLCGFFLLLGLASALLI